MGDAYTGELEEKLEAKINELYAPKADLDAASARADGLQEQLNAANEAIDVYKRQAASRRYDIYAFKPGINAFKSF